MLSEQMYNDLKDQLPAIQEAFSQGLQYGGELFHRFQMYHIVINAIYTTLLLAFVITGTIFSVKMIKKGIEKKIDDWFVGGIVLVSVTLILLMPLTLVVSVLIKAIFIPELLLIDLFK